MGAVRRQKRGAEELLHIKSLWWKLAVLDFDRKMGCQEAPKWNPNGTMRDVESKQQIDIDF